MAIPKTDDVETLQALGFDPAASPEAKIAALRSIREKAAAGDSEIARTLGEIEHPDAAAMLTEMESGASGAVRREIRRALFRLRQHGIASTPAVTPAASQAQPAAPEEAGLSALLSPIDGEGARVVWILKSRPGAGMKRMWALVSESEGLLGATLGSISRKELRTERAELERRSGVPMFEVDWRLADFIMCEAFRATPESRRTRVGDFFTARAELIASAPTTALEHPIYKEFAAEAAGDPSVELLKEPEIAAWRLAPEQVKPFADEAANLRNSTIVLSPIQQEERVNAVVDRALGELLTGATAYRLRRYLEDTALYLAHSGRRPQAGWAAAAAAKIRDGAELRRIAFFQNLMRAQMGAIIAEQQEHEQEEPRLIMTPAEAMRAQEAARARMRQRGR